MDTQQCIQPQVVPGALPSQGEPGGQFERALKQGHRPCGEDKQMGALHQYFGEPGYLMLEWPREVTVDKHKP